MSATPDINSTTQPVDHRLRIFLSFEKKDSDRVAGLYKALVETEGPFDIWFDEEKRSQLLPGQNWVNERRNGLLSSEVVLFCLSSEDSQTTSVAPPSSSSSSSSQARSQIENDRILLDESPLLKGNSIYLIPVRLEPCDVPENLQDLIAVDLFGNPDKDYAAQDGFQRLMQALWSSVTQQTAQSTSNTTLKDIFKQGMKADEIEKNATNDKPIEKIEEDKLGFTPYAEALYEFINSQETTTPLAISINGPWGTGKSSLMNMLKQKLEPTEGKHWNFLWRGLAWHIARPFSIFMEWFGRFLIFLFSHFGTQTHAQDIAEGLDYKPNEFNAKRIEQLPLRQQHWAKIKARQASMPPPFHPTVWFNAWKFSQEEQLWAALASEVLEQLQAKYPWPLRFVFWFKLFRRRSKPVSAAWQLLRNFLPTLCLALVTALYTVYILPHFQLQLPKGAPQVTYLLLISTVLSSLYDGIKAANPFKIPLNQIFDNPDYASKIGYIGRFEEDFERIVKVVTQLSSKAWETQKLVIFIDDLDRCPPLQAVSIIEAVSLFLDSRQCVFVIGMDQEAVVTSIEAKYKELVEKIRRETPGVVSPGSLFLEKIVQISLRVPHSTEQDITNLVDEIIRPKSQTKSITPSPTTQIQSLKVPALSSSLSQLSAAPSSPSFQIQVSNVAQPFSSIPSPQIQISNVTQPSSSLPQLPTASTSSPPSPTQLQADRANFGHKDVRDAIQSAVRLLGENPRKVKRFVNLFRLYVYIADKHDLLKERISGRQSNEQGLKPLAILVAWSMQWPEVAKLVRDESHNSSICAYLKDISQGLQDNGSWKPQTSLENNGNQKIMNAKLDEILLSLKQKREEENSPAHWSYLPWDIWVRDRNFLYCLKYMEDVWKQPDEQKDARLQSILNLTKLMAL